MMADRVFNSRETACCLTNDLVNDIRIVHFQSKRSISKIKIELQYNLILFPINGLKSIVTKRNTITFNENNFVILSNGSQFVCETNRKDGDFIEGIFIMFNNKILNDFLLKYPDFQKIKKDRTSQYLKNHIECTKSSFIQNCLLPSLNYITHGNAPDNICSVKFEEFMLDLFSQNPEKINWFINLICQQESTIQQIVENNVYKNISIATLASMCNLSLSTFKRHFIQIYGMSPKKYFLMQKMDKATVLLQTKSKENIKVYDFLGFNTNESFIKSFKKHHGITPSEYRKSVSSVN
ncbi:helix-turn-helix domain-containing protein [Flavobacterium cerinum]|uniref:AraC family transcriptional regulator n=1 Tax=Flavobacterium cerinum TaxID=2502784 RepID=A0ABY5IN58_9FLAO|nr:AraC family transcriptional regulator [Flavobacterium cerinum]UUC44054.1 AraC family transcriptional regulator [Flavobacterium cerinum]